MTTEHMKQLFIFVFSVLALISCDSGTDRPEAIMEPVAAEVTARIGPVSRAAGTDWAENDRIGISGVSGSKTYANVEYRIADAATGEFTAVGNGIFYQTNQPVVFTAYYPFTGTDGTAQASIAGNTRAGNQTAAAQPGIDYMWAQATGSYKKPVNFSFSHKMSRLSLTFVSGDGIDVSDMTSFSVDGLKMEGTFDTATGTATATGIAETLTVSDPALTSLILYPQEVAGGIVIRVLIDGQTYGCLLENIEELLPGMDYAITITVSKTGLTVSSCTIADWGNGPNYNGDATLQ